MRGPQGLASTGDKFNHDTDQFFSGLGDFLLKQVDDLVVQGNSKDDLLQKLEITAREAEDNNCTWSISKFSLGRPVNIISGFQVTLDPTGKNPPQIGPDPSRIEKLTAMKPPTTVKEVRSILGLIVQLGRFSTDYTMLTPKLRGLLNKKNVKFEWTSEHQEEYDRVMESYSNLEKLQPYKPGNRIFGLTDASYQGLGKVTI